MTTRKLKSRADLNNLRKRILNRNGADKPFIAICCGTGCMATNSSKIVECLRKELRSAKLDHDIDVKTTGCHGFCERGPLMVIHPSGVLYCKVSIEDIPEIVAETISKGRTIERLLYTDAATGKKIEHEKDVPFYKGQSRILLRNNGLIDPAKIEEYITVGGYEALAKALSEMTPEEVILEVKKSNLRGRGGAGFPTASKWQLCRDAKGDVKYVVCNADEGDPGAFMNSALLDGNPHSVLEGMIIGAYAIGAPQGFIYVRHEYPLAVKSVGIAIDQMREYGLLGEDILGSGFNFDLKIATGAGAFVCGEETALIASIEGRKGEPRQRPPFPAERGIWGLPTNINNVETWANVPLIIEKGAQWFKKIGTEKSSGTKIFSLVGKINNTGLAEVPMGTPIHEMIYGIGGGIPNDKKLKAVQTGGPSGGCIPAEKLQTPIDYENLGKLGSIMGSGGIVVMDEDTCMVDVAKYFLGFLQEESCGKCMTCREGIERMLEMVTDITEGNGTEDYMATLTELGKIVKDASMCGLGQSAPNSLLSTMRFFSHEYEEHIKYKRCSAAVCKEIISSPCQHTCPIGTEAPAYISSIARGEFRSAFDIIRKDNPLPSICGRVCNHPCEGKCQSGKFGDPIAIRALKRFVADQAAEKKWKYEPIKEARKQKKVAVVGSGPAGLTAGYFLALKGYAVTVFESLPVVGGALVTCIPEYRLPRDVLNRDIKNIVEAGVEIKTSTTVGKDIPLETLRKNYDAVFVASGAHKSVKLGVPNEDSEGVMYAMEFLKDVHLGQRKHVGKKVGVIGGGNAAVDAARVAKRLQGAEEVTLIYRRTRQEMPAFEEEVEACLEEGIKLQVLMAPKRILTQKGKVTGIECVRMELGEVDESGRRRPRPIAGSEHQVMLDAVIIAVGERPDTKFTDAIKGIAKTESDGRIVTDKETFMTGEEGVFAGGDVITGPNTVIEAMHSGRIASEMIDLYLSGKKVAREYKVTRPSVYIEPVVLTDEETANMKRPAIRRLQVESRAKKFQEVELALSGDDAIREARRCLRCDLETEEGKRQFEKGGEST